VTNIADLLTGASQLAAILAAQSGPGFSKNADDHQPAKVRMSGPEFNDADPKYRPDLPPGGFLLGEVAIAPEGLPVIVLGMLSGCMEQDRVAAEGRNSARDYALRLYKIWERQPEVKYITGKGGGKQTARGGWITSWYDEIFLLTPYGLAVLPLYDMHHVVVTLNRRAESLGASAMYDIKWRLTNNEVPDGDYTRHQPHFEPLDVEPSGAEVVQAEKLCALVSRLSYAIPDASLRLVVGGDIGSPPEPTAPPVKSLDDYDGGPPNPDDIPF
jgi:hypothetical protein